MYFTANHHNLNRLINLRWLVLVSLVILFAVSDSLIGSQLLTRISILTPLLLGFLFNIASFYYFRKRLISELVLFFQFLFDILIVSLFLYQTGGASNPFVSYYLVPLTLSSAILRMRLSIVLYFLIIAVYSILLKYYQPLDVFQGSEKLLQKISFLSESTHDMSHHGHEMMNHSGFSSHVLGMWFNFIISAAFIVFFVNRMGSAIRDQDKKISEQNQKILQREKVVSMGVMAAGAAHELGTPLSTMLVLADEVAAELPKNSSAEEDIMLLKKQIYVCKNILQQLRLEADSQQKECLLNDFLKQLLDRVQVLYPSKSMLFQEYVSMYKITPPILLSQVLVNLLDNAAQAANAQVLLSLTIESDFVVFEIRDDGKGFEADELDKLGVNVFPSTDTGLGIGYLLSHVSVNQLHGRLHVSKDKNQQGACVQLKIPKQELQLNMV